MSVRRETGECEARDSKGSGQAGDWRETWEGEVRDKHQIGAIIVRVRRKLLAKTYKFLDRRKGSFIYTYIYIYIVDCCPCSHMLNIICI